MQIHPGEAVRNQTLISKGKHRLECLTIGLGLRVTARIHLTSPPEQTSVYLKNCSIIMTQFIDRHSKCLGNG